MKVRSVNLSLCRWVLAIGIFLVTAYGVYSFEGADFGRDMLAMSLFCVLPFLSFQCFSYPSGRCAGPSQYIGYWRPDILPFTRRWIGEPARRWDIAMA